MARGPKGSAGDEEDEEADREVDDRFAVVRGQMSRALLRRQSELVQSICSLCSSLLLQPTRLVNCRHALCALCVERSTMCHLP